MKVIRSVHELQNELSNIKDQTIGYVPTMGFFHEGHLSLMKTAREETDFVVVSIFVNPLQFGPHEDFEQYPRDEEKDLKLAKENGVDLVFLPDVSDMYPNEASITMQVVRRTDVLCGRSRPRSEEHTSELQSRGHLVCRLLLEKKKTIRTIISIIMDTL